MNKKILVVDDSEFDRKLISKVLEKNGFQVSTLDGGENCEQFIETEKPDLVLLDIVMAAIDGNQVLHSIRRKYNSIELPIIMTTGKSDASDIVESLSLGANDYVVKPINYEVTIMRVMTHLKISDLCRDMANLTEINAVNSMIATYNHEINNPLAIALGSLTSCIEKFDKTAFERLERALWRISDIIKKIEAVPKPKPVQYETKANSSFEKMLKIK